MDPKGRQLRRRSPAAGALLAAAALVACDFDPAVTPEPISLWEATLGPAGAALPGAVVTGRAAVVVQTSGMEVGISVEGAADDVLLDWGVFRGACDSPGEILATPSSYPTLSADEPEAEIWLGTRLARDGSYHVGVFEQTDGAPVACGDLMRVETPGEQ